jgi:hypothetical protein
MATAAHRAEFSRFRPPLPEADTQSHTAMRKAQIRGTALLAGVAASWESKQVARSPVNGSHNIFSPITRVIE